MKKSTQKKIVAFFLLVVMLASQIANGSCVTYAYDYSSAITIKNASNSDVYVEINRHSGGNHDWQEYGYSIKNNTSKTIDAITLTVPTNGSVTAFSCWNISARYSGGNVIITYTKGIKPGETITCTPDEKFGFSGGGTLSTPTYSLGVSDTAPGLKYSVKGATKNLSASETPVGKHGALSVKKVSAYTAPTIVDKNGNAVMLRGVSTHGAQWFPQYINKDAFQSLRDEWGINTVRLAIYPREGGYIGNEGTLDKKIEEGVEAAKSLGMYVIIDWHVLSYNPNETKSEAETFFKKYATKYKDYNNVIFEICNEPTGTNWYDGSGNDIYSYGTKITSIIRNCGSNAIILCGTNTWSQDVDDVAKKPLSDSNVMYNLHFYASTHYDNIKDKMKRAIASGTPVFVSEFGLSEASGNGSLDASNATDWMNLMKANNISYACWSLCNKGETASLLTTSCSKTSKWTGTDLTEAGIWLVNASRGLEEVENAGSGSTDSGNTDSGNTGSGNTGSESTGSGSTDSGNTDSGNTGSESTDSGNTDAGNTDSGNTGSESTDSGNTGSGNTGSESTDSGNTDAGNTDSGNTGSGSTDSGNTDVGNTDTDMGNTGSEDDYLTDSLVITKLVAVPKTYNSVKICWTKVDGASGYQVDKYVKDHFQTVATTEGGSYTATGLTTGATYTYQVTAFKYVGDEKVYGESKYINVKPVLGQVKSFKVTNKSYKKTCFRWGRVYGASGYKIYYSTKKNGKYVSLGTIKNGKTVTAKCSKLKKGKIYYFKAVAYRKVGSKTVYSKPSTVTAAKIK